MNKLEELEKLKIEVQNLERGYTNKREALLLKAGVIVDNFFEGKKKYHDVLNSTNFYFRGFNSGGNNTTKEQMWNSGKNKLIGLIDTLIYDLEVSKGSQKEDQIIQTNFSDKLKVFIVHGHDDGAKETVARFVAKLGFEAIILHEQANSGSTIIEKLEKHTDVGFAIVLYTACDIGGVKSEPNNLKPRARQNVVFEHGLLIGKIGRENVVALVKEDVETPGDISGMVYEPMDIGGAWKYRIAREMKSSGYDVDMNKID
ncbi:TIR domain-containing protein [Psychrobacter aquaticus]|uniref:Putative nucleotide-binding protein n=1 Tax=Psychrobacter aquaticus CMS 56 TaxID=1354303 RepID=U4T7G6_9GAMM|nr:nucleotide-binding protein [Psychrobacter aquaticus]ERL56870.1 putative nucleotide-binding protein [Psychrobacter aquaticus CMS 56]